ncbi:MAG: NAD(P)/FAD-dependent oxidoreductase [Asgard group archaeon]|nr:NAD(P)/FAD-dependent oxidoreductase [Asgard group archaeon]
MVLASQQRVKNYWRNLNMINNHPEVIVIGAGPAGCATAIQLKRYEIDVLVFEKNQIGGLARNANFIENFPGFPKGITGEKFSSLLKEHINQQKIQVTKEEIKEIDWNDKSKYFILKSSDKEYTCNYLVLAIGTDPKKLKQKGVEKLLDKGRLFYEPVDIPENQISEKSIVIIGGGDAAFDYALNLANKNYQVTIIHRRSSFSCLPLLYERATNNNSIEIKPTTHVKKFEINENLVTLHLNNDEILTPNYILVAIGRKASKIDVHKNLKKLRKENRIYLVGDLISGLNRQISIASGQGLECAMRIARDLKKR